MFQKLVDLVHKVILVLYEDKKWILCVLTGHFGQIEGVNRLPLIKWMNKSPKKENTKNSKTTTIITMITFIIPLN